ncbi:MAG: ribonuclease Z [Flavobacteriaceae bacterium]
MNLTILGSHSATPRENKHTTSQVLDIKGHLFLIDCGEGTQMQLRKAQVKFSRIQYIFISHLHGDHFYGLIGLISTFRLLGRTTPLYIYGPEGIKEIITIQLKLAKSWTNYPLIFHELSSEKSELIYEQEGIQVQTLPLDHRVYTNGFLFSYQSFKRKINAEKVSLYNLQAYHYNQLQNGMSITLEDGRVFSNEELTSPPAPVKRYAFCSDTAYYPPLIELIKGVDLLYHESTFLEDHHELANKTKHSTAIQAATIAREAKVKQLLLGHFSNRYRDKNDFIKEAKKVFDHVALAEDLKTFIIE